MSPQRQGDAAEAAVTAHFLTEGYDVFSPFGGHGPFDLVVHRDGQLLRVEVKSTTVRTATGWNVQLKRVRTNGSGHVLRYFDASAVDLLAVYIVPERRVVVLDASLVDGMGAKVVS